MKVFLAAILFVGLCVLGLGFNIFFRKDGHFPDTEISTNPNMKKLGIKCVKEEEKSYFEDLLKYVVNKNLDGVVTLRKNTPYKEMVNEYLANDVLVLTSKQEECTVTMADSLSYGLLTISTDHNGSASYVDKESGYIFKTCNPESLAGILKDI